MAVLMSLEIEVPADQYDKVDKEVDAKGDPPDGFLAHTAEDLDGKMRIVDVWESADAFGAFAESRLGPAIGKVLGDDAPQVEPQFTELHNAYTS